MTDGIRGADTNGTLITHLLLHIRWYQRTDTDCKTNGIGSLRRELLLKQEHGCRVAVGVEADLYI